MPRWRLLRNAQAPSSSAPVCRSRARGPRRSPPRRLPRSTLSRPGGHFWASGRGTRRCGSWGTSPSALPSSTSTSRRCGRCCAARKPCITSAAVRSRSVTSCRTRASSTLTTRSRCTCRASGRGRWGWRAAMAMVRCFRCHLTVRLRPASGNTSKRAQPKKVATSTAATT